MSWSTVRADQFCTLITDGTHDSPKPQQSGWKLITSKHLKGHYIDFDSANWISEADYLKVISRSAVEQWDILFSMIGTIGNIYLEKNPHIEYACKNMGIFKFSGNKENALWMYYYLKSPQAKAYIQTHLRGSTQAYVPLGGLREMPVPVPPQSVRNEIIAVLRPIDEKIECNNAINDNLLEQALTLYATQFSSLELNGCIGDYCSVKSGFAFKSSWWTNCGVRVIKIGSINQDNLNLLECSYVDEAKANKAKDFVVKAGDLLIAMTGATIGKFAMVPYSSEVLLVNQRVGKFFLGNNPVEKLPFIYCTLKQPEVYGEVVNRGQGSAQPNISASDIMSIPCGIPNQDAINDFNDMSRPLFDLIISNQRENWQLSELRNALLPKLMSGELDVSGIEL